MPHFAIAQKGLSSQEFEDIFGQVALAGVDHKEIIDELTLLRFDDDEDKWKVIETFKCSLSNIIILSLLIVVCLN